MIDVTNVFNNNKYGIVKDNKIINTILVHPNDTESILPQIIEHHKADESVEIAGDLSWLGIGCIKYNNTWLPAKTYESWVWNGQNWQAPIPKPEGNHIWNEDIKAWIPIPE